MKYTWKDGHWVEKSWHPPRPRLHLIGDTSAPFRSMADGQMYDSKSAYRADLQARGMQELGSDRPEPKPVPDQSADIQREIHRAIEEGPQPGVSAPEGFREDLI